MSWTYDSAISRDLDAVRLAIGDTDEWNPELQDEEITYLLTKQSNILLASISACRRLAGKYAYHTNVVIDGRLTEGGAARQGHFLALAAALREDMIRGGSGPVVTTSTGQAGLVYAGGLSQDEHLRDSQNTDLTAPVFTKEAFSQPGTEPNSGGNDRADTDHFFNP